MADVFVLFLIIYISHTSSQYRVSAASDRSLMALSSLYLATSSRCASDSCSCARGTFWEVCTYYLECKQDDIINLKNAKNRSAINTSAWENVR